MKGQTDPKHYVIREWLKYWSSISFIPVASIQELAARIRHDAVMRNFTAIRDPLDVAMRTYFMCSASNEAVLKAPFKFKEEKLTFAKAIDLNEDRGGSESGNERSVWDDKKPTPQVLTQRDDLLPIQVSN